jgi:ribulose-phosphate 3-epimerase
MQIIPTILEKEFALARIKIEAVKDISKWIQVDVIDEKFSQGKTFELELINKVLKETEDVLWEIHLMVKEPKNWIEKCNFVNASRIVGQIEMMTNREEFVDKVKNLGIEAGLAIDIDSEIGEIPEETDLVLLLGRKAGFKSENFNKKVFEKIEELKKIREEKQLEFEIGIDGGVDETNIGILNKAGVSIAYCGGAIFNGKVEDNLEKLKYASEN